MIRKAQIDDVEIIYHLYAQFNSDDQVGYEMEDFAQLIDSEKCVFLVATDDNVIGYILAYDHVNWGYVDSVVVDPSHRHSGVGQALFNEIEKIGRKRKWWALSLCHTPENTNLIKFTNIQGYQRLTPNFVWKYRCIE